MAINGFSREYLNEWNGYQVVICAVILVVLSAAALTLRFMARHLQRIHWGWDDGFTIAGAVLLYALIACCLTSVYTGGVGYHLAALMNSPEKVIVIKKMYIIVTIFHLSANAMPKLSIICLYLRIFDRPTHPVQRNICWATGAIVVVDTIASMIPAFAVCRPLKYLWTSPVPDKAHCIDLTAWWRWHAIGGILADLVMMGLPIPLIWNLNVVRSVKISLAVIFTLGSLGFAAAIARFVGFFAYNSELDPSWTSTILLILTMVEPAIYLISACLLAMKPLLVRLLQRLRMTFPISGSPGKPEV